MSTTFPLSGDRGSPGGRASLGVVASGPFGERIGRHLLAAYADARMMTTADLRNAFAAARLAVVVALWRPEPELCEQADQLSQRHGLPWLAVTMEHRVICVGPLVNGQSPCFRCYSRRRVQHDTQSGATAALLAAYKADVSAGPQGYLPHHARIAAGVARQMLWHLAPADASRRHGVAPGQVATIRLHGGGISVSPVVACHDCDRCGGPPGPAGGLDALLSEPGVMSPDLARYQGLRAAQGVVL